MILRANHVISKRRSSYLCLGAWFWTVWTIELNPMAEKFDSVTGKINPCVEQIAIRSMTWNAAHTGWMVCGLWVFVDKWSVWLTSWCRSKVIQRSFGGRENWLNNDPWIHSNYTIWKSDPCQNSRNGSGPLCF